MPPWVFRVVCKQAAATLGACLQLRSACPCGCAGSAVPLTPGPVPALAPWNGRFLSLVSFARSIQALLLRKKGELNGTAVTGCKKCFLESPSCTASRENRAERNGDESTTNSPRGSLHSAAFPVWLYMAHYCCKPTLVPVRPDWHHLIWIFMLSL